MLTILDHKTCYVLKVFGEQVFTLPAEIRLADALRIIIETNWLEEIKICICNAVFRGHRQHISHIQQLQINDINHEYTNPRSVFCWF